MWPFLFRSQKEREFIRAFRESDKPKEETPEENWDISLWLFDPDRTVEELEHFAETGQRPSRFTKLTWKTLPTGTPKETFPIVSYPAKAAEKGKPRADFPPNPSVGHTFLDRESGTYYSWSGKKWKVLANTPPQPKKNLPTEEGVKGVILNLERPFFANQLREKKWCAREVSLLLGCQIQVSEDQNVGIITIEGEQYRHPIVNWGWREKTIEEFIEHLYCLWVLQSKVKEND